MSEIKTSHYKIRSPLSRPWQPFSLVLLAVALLFLLMTLGDQLLVSRLSGVAQYAALLACHVLRFLLPLAVCLVLALVFRKKLAARRERALSSA